MSDQLIHVTTNSSTADAPWRVSMQAGHHDVVADEPEPAGDTGPSPFELYLASLGSCTAITIRMYAERKGWALESVSVDLSYRTGADPGRIERALHFAGRLDEAQRARLADIAERTPVTKVVKAGVEVLTTVAAA
jgi:putative redox protein